MQCEWSNFSNIFNTKIKSWKEKCNHCLLEFPDHSHFYISYKKREIFIYYWWRYNIPWDTQSTWSAKIMKRPAISFWSAISAVLSANTVDKMVSRIFVLILWFFLIFKFFINISWSINYAAFYIFSLYTFNMNNLHKFSIHLIYVADTFLIFYFEILNFLNLFFLLILIIFSFFLLILLIIFRKYLWGIFFKFSHEFSQVNFYFILFTLMILFSFFNI